MIQPSGPNDLRTSFSVFLGAGHVTMRSNVFKGDHTGYVTPLALK